MMLLGFLKAGSARRRKTRMMTKSVCVSAWGREKEREKIKIGHRRAKTVKSRF